MAGGAPGAVQDRWLASFDDPSLPPLAEEALRYNIDLRVAAARVEIAAASVKMGMMHLYAKKAVRSGRMVEIRITPET